jgi:2'-5' RNA ligase
MQALPIILTLQLNTEAEVYFTNLRKQYFPKELNFIDAHLTLFHHLPAHEPIVFDTLQQIAQGPNMPLDVISIKNIGNGTAFTISSSPLQQLHKMLQQKFAHFLIPQDKQRLWPHITIQNKVNAATAKQTTELLSNSFKPFSVQGIGISSWYYLGGPWQANQQFLFKG